MKLLIVANRLPVTVEIHEGALALKDSPGGVVSALTSFLNAPRPPSATPASLFDRAVRAKEGRSARTGQRARTRPSAAAAPGVPGTSPGTGQAHWWIGWPGGVVLPSHQQELKETLARAHQASPVFLSGREADKFYQGFCNRTIWPLFNYFTSYVDYDESQWRLYQEVQQKFCNAVVEMIEPHDMVWIHDYHLMLLPQLLRARRPDVAVGFFLHIPFPSFEIFRILPRECRRAILEGLLGADVVGFHTYDYAQHFLRCVRRALGYEYDVEGVKLPAREVKVDAFPLGIDYEKFHRAHEHPDVRRETRALQEARKDARTILSIDRLDYTKGILNRLRGFELFLERNPQWREKVTLILSLVPSRTAIEAWQRMKRNIDEQVGEINGRFGSVHWTPIRYQYTSLLWHELTALYGVSDVALVTPLRDGMNLIAKEYVAARADETGVLILSEIAGAAQELGEALLINPYDAGEIAQALVDALAMPREEQVRRNRLMQQRLKRYDVVRWADEFLAALDAAHQVRKDVVVNLLNADLRARCQQDYIRAARRLLCLDYDGTLQPFASSPHLAAPTAELMELLGRLAADGRNTLIIVSGRGKGTLETWLGTLPGISFIAEHGAWTRARGEDWQSAPGLHHDWKTHVLPLLERTADRVPGTFVEEKEYSLVWHYRRADPEIGAQRAKELIDDVMEASTGNGFQVVPGNKVVEVRHMGVDKGTALQPWLDKGNYDYIAACGDDTTDEDIFRILPSSAWSVKVGMGQSAAKYRVLSHTDIITFLGTLVA